MTVKDVSESFNERLMFLVLDTYRDDSLKSATRDKSRQGRAPIQYQVKEDTNIQELISR